MTTTGTQHTHGHTIVSRYMANYPWKEALVWLCLLAPFFFITYGFANHFTATRTDVGVCVFTWERHIPFLPWTIIPYWSIDLFYGLSLFICSTRSELRMQVKRLALSTVLCVTGFLLVPLRVSFTKPVSDGMFGWLFDKLATFDLPYNQAPSLHICLLVVLWDLYRRHVPVRWLPFIHGWSLLIGISVLTTYQHHSIDILTGLMTGILCCYLVPQTPWRTWKSAQPVRARTIGCLYLAGFLIGCLSAYYLGGWGWLLVYPALALVIVALGYFQLGSQVMQKNTQSGCHSFAATWMLAPYRSIAALTRRYYLAQLPGAVEILPGLWLGGYPGSLPTTHCSVLDLCAEYPRSSATLPALQYTCVPLLDLLTPTASELTSALTALNTLRAKGPVLVHCALGLTRSAAVTACYIAEQQHIPLPDAFALIEEKSPTIVLSPEARKTLEHTWASIHTSLQSH